MQLIFQSWDDSPVWVKLHDFTWLPSDQSEVLFTPHFSPKTRHHSKCFPIEKGTYLDNILVFYGGDTWAQKSVSQLTSLSWWSWDLTPGSAEPETVFCSFRLAWVPLWHRNSHFCSRLQHVWEGRVSTGPHGNLWALWSDGTGECFSAVRTLVSHERAGLLNSTSRTLVSLTFLLEHAPPRVPWTISASVLQNLHLLHTYLPYPTDTILDISGLQLNLLARVRTSTELSCGTLAADASQVAKGSFIYVPETARWVLRMQPSIQQTSPENYQSHYTPRSQRKYLESRTAYPTGKMDPLGLAYYLSSSFSRYLQLLVILFYKMNN